AKRNCHGRTCFHDSPVRYSNSAQLLRQKPANDGHPNVLDVYAIEAIWKEEAHMLGFIGIALVFVAVFGGYLLERGNPYVLMQPAEVLIIVGAAAGMTLVANPWSVIRKMLLGALATFRPSREDRHFFLRHLRMLYEVFV